MSNERMSEFPALGSTAGSLEYSCPKLIGVIGTEGNDHPHLPLPPPSRKLTHGSKGEGWATRGVGGAGETQQKEEGEQGSPREDLTDSRRKIPVES